MRLWNADNAVASGRDSGRISRMEKIKTGVGSGEPGVREFETRSSPIASFSKSAFSLIEVTLAIGVIAFALVGIMALFPAATKAAQESQRETRATFIAAQIFSDLTTFSPTNAILGVSPELAQTPTVLRLDLSTNSTNAISYDEEGRFFATTSADSFETANSDAAFFTRVTIQTNNLPPGLSRVEVLVTAPASAPLTNRSRYPFVSLLRNR